MEWNYKHTANYSYLLDLRECWMVVKKRFSLDFFGFDVEAALSRE